MKNTFLLLLLTIGFVGYSQGENDNWYFGRNAAINFANNPPTVLSNSNMIQLEGVSSISDANGNLLFYSNGINVWDKNHNIMPNGSGLLGHDSAEQGVVIVPFPGITNRYYLFTSYASPLLPPNGTQNPYNYSIIDMSLNGGNGDIITGQKNLPLNNELGNILLPGASTHESMTCILSQNEAFYWLLVPVTHPVNKLYAYKIDHTGLINTPVTSNINFSANTSGFANWNTGCIKVNESRTKIAICKWLTNHELRIYSFNSSTGQVTGNIGTCTNCDAYSMEFETFRDDELLYYTSNTTGGLNVINVLNGNIRQIISNNFQAGLQRAKDNIIYISKYAPGYMNDTQQVTYTNNHLYQITDSYSFSFSNFVLTNQIFLGTTRFAGLGLPQLNYVIPQSECLPYRILSNITDNYTYNYKASIDITTQNNYVANSTSIITLKAGNSVMLKPNTHIKSGADFLAKIEACVLTREIGSITSETANSPYTVNAILGEDEIFGFKMYPNPVTDGTLHLESDANGEKTILIYDLMGKMVLNITTSESIVNVSTLNIGVYMIEVTEEGRTVVKKLVIR
ncbi:MAG: T9SS type A sorting domain-containing protein [Bacteroidota bacterium]